MRINDDPESESPVLDVNLEHVPTDVEVWVRNEQKETIAVIALEELLKDELNWEGNFNGDFVLKDGVDKRLERSAQIFERMAAMIRSALIAKYIPEDD